MMGKIDKYPIETAAEKLIDQLRISLKKITKFFFVIPEKKMDKYIYIMETISWILLGLALIWRIRG